MVDAYPLQWPTGWARTKYRKAAAFNTRFAVARDVLIRQLKLMGAASVVVSSDIPLRNDGIPYANYRNPDDPGIAVYFIISGEPRCMACDKYKYQ